MFQGSARRRSVSWQSLLHIHKVFFHNKEVFFWCLDFKMIYYMCLYDKQEKPFVFNNVLIPSGTTGLPKAAYNDHSRFI